MPDYNFGRLETARICYGFVVEFRDDIGIVTGGRPRTWFYLFKVEISLGKEFCELREDGLTLEVIYFVSFCKYGLVSFKTFLEYLVFYEASLVSFDFWEADDVFSWLTVLISGHSLKVYMIGTGSGPQSIGFCSNSAKSEF